MKQYIYDIILVTIGGALTSINLSDLIALVSALIVLITALIRFIKEIKKNK